LRRTLDRFKEAERVAAAGGLTFAQALRLLSGADVADGDESGHADPEWSEVVSGP